MIEVVVSFDAQERQVSAKTIRRIVRFVLKKEHVTEGKISIVLVGDSRIKKINTKYLGHNVRTDVITFPIEPLPTLEAEIYVNVTQARRQARAYSVTIGNELVRLIIHGVLHSVGYDDKRTNQRKILFELQERYTRLCAAAVGAI